MRAKQIRSGAERTWILVLETGEEVVATLRRFAAENELSGSHFSAIGALRHVVFGVFDWATKDYRRILLDEQTELLSLTGTITEGSEGPAIHGHIVVGKADGSAHGGHLLEAHVRPTLELVITEEPGHLARRRDPETGLPLIDLEGARPHG